MDALNFNIFNIIIISGVIHGIIFSVIVFTTKKFINNNTVFLGLTVLLLSLSNFQYWLIDTSLIDFHPYLKYIYIPWHWLVLPMFYLYVHKLISKEKISSNYWILLIGPFIVILLIHIFLLIYKYFINTNFETPSHFQRGIYVYLEYFSFVFNVFVMYLTFRKINRFENDPDYEINRVKSETNWLKRLIYIGLVVCLCWLVAIIIVIVYDLNKTYVFYPMWIGISVLVYWIGYAGLNKSTQLRERIKLRKKRILEFVNAKNDLVHKDDSNSFFKLQEQIEINKMHLDPNLSLKKLSEQLNMSPGYISQLINSNSPLNFNDYINRLRVNDALTMLTERDYENYTVLAIGLEAGFNSKSSFYTAFKKFTDKTPSEYRKSVRNN